MNERTHPDRSRLSQSADSVRHHRSNGSLCTPSYYSPIKALWSRSTAKRIVYLSEFVETLTPRPCIGPDGKLQLSWTSAAPSRPPCYLSAQQRHPQWGERSCLRRRRTNPGWWLPGVICADGQNARPAPVNAATAGRSAVMGRSVGFRARIVVWISILVRCSRRFARRRG